MKKIEKRFFKSNKGAVMMEVIVALALIILITPMIYTRVSEYTQEIEDGATASKLRLLKQGMSSYIEANYEKIVDGTIVATGTGVPTAPLADGVAFDQFTIDVEDAELQKFIRPEYYENSKMFNGIEIAVKRKKIGETVVLNAIIVTKTKAGDTIPKARGNRIAGLVGSEAGYIEDTKAKGIGGFVELNIGEYFKTNPGEKNEQIAISTGYFPADIRVSTQEAPVDFLFRKKYDVGSYPPNYDPTKAHRMETYIDFGKTLDSGELSGHSVEDVGVIYGKEYTGSTTEDLSDFTYIDTKGTADKDDDVVADFVTYGVNFETNTAFLDDVRVASLGGAKITEVLPNLILMSVFENITYGSYVPIAGYENPKVIKKNIGCPTGYSTRYELVQKEMLKSVDTLAVAQHIGDYATGIHSVRSWLRNNKLLRSSFKIDDAQYYRIYGNNAEIVGECIGTDASDIKCATFEYNGNTPKLSEYCTYNETVVYDINDTNNNVDFSGTAPLPFVANHDSLKKWAKYNKNGSITIHSDPDKAPVVTLDAGGTLKCTNKNYCPGYEVGKDIEIGSSNQYAKELMQHGSCQAALNTVINGNFLPYGESEWIEVKADGSASSSSGHTISENLSNTTNVDPSGGIYYITRVFHKVNTASINSNCPTGSAIFNSKKGLCYDNGDEAYRRFTNLPVKHDLYYYCEKN